jgi:hypothetical protein
VSDSVSRKSRGQNGPWSRSPVPNLRPGFRLADDTFLELPIFLHGNICYNRNVRETVCTRGLTT